MAATTMDTTAAITSELSLELGCSGFWIVPLLAAVFFAVVLVISAVVVGGSVVGLHRGSSSTGGQFTERVWVEFAEKHRKICKNNDVCVFWKVLSFLSFFTQVAIDDFLEKVSMVLSFINMLYKLNDTFEEWKKRSLNAVTFCMMHLCILVWKTGCQSSCRNVHNNHDTLYYWWEKLM